MLKEGIYNFCSSFVHF